MSYARKNSKNSGNSVAPREKARTVENVELKKGGCHTVSVMGTCEAPWSRGHVTDVPKAERGLKEPALLKAGLSRNKVYMSNG